MTNYDPDNPDQGVIHQCQMYARRHLNPIIDWTTEEVWEFIHKYDVPYCCLYDQGFTRLGCIGCPMGGVKCRQEEFERWPTYKQAYIHAFDRMIQARIGGGITTQSNTERSCSENGAETILGNSTTTTEQNNKQEMGSDECRREVRVLDESDLIPAKIEVIDKMFVALSTNWKHGEEVMEWWIR